MHQYSNRTSTTMPVYVPEAFEEDPAGDQAIADRKNTSGEHHAPIASLLREIHTELTLIREELHHPEAERETAPVLLTLEQVATKLSVSPRTVETLVAAGELIPVRIRGARRFAPESVDAFVRTQSGSRNKRPNRHKAA